MEFLLPIIEKCERACYTGDLAACYTGDLAAVQACILGKRSAANIHGFYRAAWRGGQMHVLRWLASTFRASLVTDIHAACLNGWLGLAQWLHAADEHTGFTPTAEMFKDVCTYGFLGVAQWLHGFGTATDAWVKAAFPPACRYGRLGVAKWLHSVGPVHIHADGDHALCETVFAGCVTEGARYKVARWLLSLDPEYIGWPEDALRPLRCWSPARDAWMRSVVRRQ
jgi:hypothetical protein